MDLLRMDWRDVGFLHWPVDPGVVAATLPDGLTVDIRDGQAWLGVVPFEMRDIRPRGSPIGRSFGELNLRTYVTDGDTPGVYFYNLDADDRLSVALARRLFELPYYRASMTVRRTGDGVRFRSRRTDDRAPAADFDATYGPVDDEPHEPAPRSLESFLVSRYRFYVADDAGTIYYADIDHEPWPLQAGEVDIRENDLFAANGFDRPAGDPVVYYSPGIHVRAGRLRRL
ncbi:DUF2071 domain-containing protein [Haloarcula sp. S1CR25-12]|uniref:DUF2071 domain-containing protein n=1 Tax=Haloarcula saliterrae TaxID=2950534 RepID=A0ABU2F9M2_9EURY|nr:DUF2071 domain-containing protein [Haloarcula sp. S1CR25-12]MDS0258411.1 DUF2071 domain-containing protein [Haloarcula sp. S1CR25-12]